MQQVVKVAVNGTWYRMSAYEIRQGVIVPAPGARLESYSLFDEVQAHTKRDKKGRGLPGPHISLANVDTDSPKAILEWVNRWGLLGLLPHSLGPVDWSNGVTFVPMGETWEMNLTPGYLSPPNETFEAFRIRTARGVAPGRAIRRIGRLMEIVDAEGLLARYFPGDMSGGYPLPLTTDWWQGYGEPLNEFAATVRHMRRVLNGYATAAAGGDAAEGEWARHWVHQNAGLSLNTPFDGNQDIRTLELQSPTLLAGLAALVWMDWGQGATVRPCRRCGRLFAAMRADRDYCSTACRTTAESTRYRARKATSGGDQE